MPFLETTYPSIKQMTHEQKYTFLVNQIGLDRLIPHLPREAQNKDDLCRLIKSDRRLNNIQLKYWDIEAQNPQYRRLIDNTLKNPGLPLSQHVCILKQAARMYANK